MGLLLYLLAILFDALPMALRFWLGWKLDGSTLGYVLAFGPLWWSFAALLGAVLSLPALVGILGDRHHAAVRNTDAGCAE